MKRIQINYKPLDKSVTLSPVGGSTVQQYNATIGEHIPDWTLVPLVIQPVVFIADPDGKIASGIKNSELTDINWYENKVETGALISDSNTNYTINRTGTDNNRGRITIKRNVENSLTLIFTARFLDTRTNQGVPVQESILLRTEEVVEQAPIRLVPSYPFGKRLYVLTGQTGLKISCPLMDGMDKVSGAIYKWYMKTDGDYSLVSEGNITGVSTSDLWIPVSEMKKRITFKTEVSYNGETYIQEHILALVYGDCKVDIVVPGDGDISPTSASVNLRAEVSTQSGTLSNPENYFDFEWYDQNGTKLGGGMTLNVASSKFSLSDFAVEVKAIEKIGAKIWVADFSSNTSAVLVGNAALMFLIAINNAEFVFDAIFPTPSAYVGLMVHSGTYTVAYNISLSTAGAMKCLASSSDSSTAWLANIEGYAPGRHQIKIKCKNTSVDESGLTVEIDGNPITDKSYTAFYPLEIKEKGRLEITGNAQLVSITFGSYVLNFENRNTQIVSGSTVYVDFSPEGATLDQLIKQV